MMRRLTAEDADVIAALHKAAFEISWPASDMRGHIENDIALGWEKHGKMIGFILIRTVTDQSEILTIAVDETCRKHGVGRKLVEAGEEAATNNGATIIFLEVAEDNLAAIALYKQCGYESFGRRPAYYKRVSGRMAARLFRKNLTVTA